MSKEKYADLRINYSKFSLLEDQIPEDPFELFRLWMDLALKSELKEPNAMVLATVADNKPSARVVLLKDFTNEGIIFYTNYDSRKGHELADNPNAAVAFYWDILERQVRVEGIIVKTSAEVSDKYFYSRPQLSQLGAMVSPQSEVVPNRDFLDNRFETAKDKNEITRPDNWGGYLLQPNRFEFWQGRPNRMHDRIAYDKTEEAGWRIVRLAP